MSCVGSQAPTKERQPIKGMDGLGGEGRNRRWWMESDTTALVDYEVIVLPPTRARYGIMLPIAV